VGNPDDDRRSDPVRPDHYKGDYVMRIIEDFKLDFLSGTVVKYMLRAGNKPGDSDVQDLKKARWYLERKINGMEKNATRSGVE
jgi:hypothetical protein